MSVDSTRFRAGLAIRDLTQLRGECHPAYRVAIDYALKALEIQAANPAASLEGTCRVRIAIAVDTFGEKEAIAVKDGYTDGEAIRELVSDMTEGVEFAGIAEIDVPKIPVVVARIVEAKE